MSKDITLQIEELQQQIEQLKKQMPAQKKTPEQVGEEAFEKSKQEQKDRLNALEFFREQYRKGILTVEQIYNLKPSYGLIPTEAEFDFIAPKGLQRSGSGAYKECRKLYIENVMKAANISFYDLNFKTPRFLLRHLGLLSNPLNGKENYSRQNELAVAKQLFCTEYEKFLNSLPDIPEPVEVPDFLELLHQFEHTKIVRVEYIPD